MKIFEISDTTLFVDRVSERKNETQMLPCTFRNRMVFVKDDSMVGSYCSENKPVTKVLTNDVFPTALYPNTATLRCTAVGCPILILVLTPVALLLLLLILVVGPIHRRSLRKAEMFIYSQQIFVHSTTLLDCPANSKLGL
jgi:hypothetical protein